MYKFWRVFGSILLCIVFAFTCYFSLADKVVKADVQNVNLSDSIYCTKTNVASCFTTEQFTSAVNSLLDTTYRNGSSFSFNETLTINNQHYYSNRNYYFMFRNACYYDLNQFTSYAQANNLLNSIGDAYSVGKYKIFSFAGYDFYANLFVQNNGLWSSFSNFNNELYGGNFVYFDSSTLTYTRLDATNDLVDFSVNENEIKITAKIDINNSVLGYGVKWHNVPIPDQYSTGTNASSYISNNNYDFYNVWNNYLQNKASNKFYNHINRITFTKFELPFDLVIDYDVTNKYLFNNVYVALSTGLDYEYPATLNSIINNVKLNFYSDMYNFYDIPGTRRLIKYAFNGDITSYLTGFDYVVSENSWGGDIVKYSSTRFKINGYFDNAVYIAYDGKLSNNFLPSYFGGDNEYSLNLYRSNVEWYDIGGHLYNFMIYLIFDMPLISNITKPIYLLITGTTTTFNWVAGCVAGLGIFGAFAMVYLLFAVIKRFL